MNLKLYEQLEISISKSKLDEYSKILKTKNRKTIRYFRNRIFHFEQIFDKQNLSEVHLDIFEIIRWINLALYDITTELDEFNSVIKNKKDRISHVYISH